MHSSESLDDNLEECSEGLVEEYSSSDQDLDDYTEAEGDGDFFGQSYILEEHYTLLKSWGEPCITHSVGYHDNTVEPLLKDSLNKGHHRNYLHTKDTF